MSSRNNAHLDISTYRNGNQVLDRYVRVLDIGGALILAGDSDLENGITTTRSLPDSNVAVQALQPGLRVTMVANGPIPVDAQVLAAADGKVSQAGTRAIGKAKTAAVADGDHIDVVIQEATAAATVVPDEVVRDPTIVAGDPAPATSDIAYNENTGQTFYRDNANLWQLWVTGGGNETFVVNNAGPFNVGITNAANPPADGVSQVGDLLVEKWADGVAISKRTGPATWPVQTAWITAHTVDLNTHAETVAGNIPGVYTNAVLGTLVDGNIDIGDMVVQKFDDAIAWSVKTSANTYPVSFIWTGGVTTDLSTHLEVVGGDIPAAYVNATLGTLVDANIDIGDVVVQRFGNAIAWSIKTAANTYPVSFTWEASVDPLGEDVTIPTHGFTPAPLGTMLPIAIMWDSVANSVTRVNGTDLNSASSFNAYVVGVPDANTLTILMYADSDGRKLQLTNNTFLAAGAKAHSWYADVNGDPDVSAATRARMFQQIADDTIRFAHFVDTDTDTTGAGGTEIDVDFTQVAPATTWTINHAQGKFPDDVTIYDANEEIVRTTVNNPSVNQTVLTFALPTAGRANIEFSA